MSREIRETASSLGDLVQTAGDLVEIARSIASVLEAASRGKIKPDAERIRLLTTYMHQAADRAEAQLLARVPSVRPEDPACRTCGHAPCACDQQ